MGNCLEEALRDHHRHVEALKDARAALDAIEAEAEAARLPPMGWRLAELVGSLDDLCSAVS